MSRLLSIDLGTKRTGLALSDELQITARELITLNTADHAELFTALDEIMTQYGVKAVVVGYPISLSGTDGLAARQVEIFCQALETKGIPVFRMDERFSSIRAQSRKHGDKFVLKTERAVDAIAARIILEDYLAMKDNP